MSQRYDEQQDAAAEQMEGTVSFAVLSKAPTGDINYTFGVDDEEYPSGEEAAAQLAMLLGHHIRHVAEQFDVDESTAVELAMDTSVGFESH